MELMEHTITETIEQTSMQFQQTGGVYVARCSCGWVQKTPMGRGLKAEHQSHIRLHKLRELLDPRGAL